MIDDEINLSRIGYTQQLKRRFTLWSMLAFSSCLLGTWEGISLTLISALQSGGPSSLMYGFLLAWIGTLSNAASLAEISSIYPTAGGQYHWTYCLGPPSIRVFTSYIVGWVGCGGLIAAGASIAFIIGVQIQGLIILCNPDFEPHAWIVVLIFWGVSLFGGFMNVFAVRILTPFNYVSGTLREWRVHVDFLLAVGLHVLGFMALFMALLAVAPKNSSRFVWETFLNTTGWPNDGIAWLLGMLTSSYAMTGYDLAAHLSEEIQNAARDVPRIMVWAVVINGAMGFVWVITLLYVLPNFTTILDSNDAPLIVILSSAFKSLGATIFIIVLVIYIGMVASVGLTASSSRMMWAFARDAGFPFHQFLTHVNPRWEVPVNAIGVVVILQILIGAIYFGDATAFQAIVSVATIALLFTYLIPPALMLFYARRNLTIEYGPFKLGRFGIFLNVISSGFTFLFFVLLSFPTTYPVTASNMNYACLMLGAVLLFAVVYYLFYGRRLYKGPSDVRNGEGASLEDENAIKSMENGIQGPEEGQNEE